MTFDKFRTFRDAPADPEIWETGPVEAEIRAWSDWERQARNYVPHPNVVEAVNVALALGKPLLVTGEPGVGKSQLASAVAWQLGLGRPFKFVAKSTSESRDLFYRYDALGRFHAIEAARHVTALTGQGAEVDEEAFDILHRPDDARNFIEYSALGRAILCAHEEDAVIDLLAEVGPEAAEPRPPEHRRIFQHPGEPRRSAVLIDEIDKASADFCNDLLDEIDHFAFSVPEITDRPTPAIAADRRPFVLITSNRERELPAAFLRRCVFIDIPFPESAVARRVPRGEIGDHDYWIETILAKRIDEAAWAPLVTSAVALVIALREQARLSKQPGTAELIDMIAALKQAGADMDRFLQDQQEFYPHALRTLVKTPEDQRAAARLGLPEIRAEP